MAETLRELVVRLSLESGNFSRNMKTINQQIKEAESEFRLAGAGIDNFGNTVKGTQARLEMLRTKMDMQNKSVDQYAKALKSAEDKLRENKDRLDDYSQRLSQAKERQEAQKASVEAATQAYERYRSTLGETDSATIAAKQNMEQAESEYKTTSEEVAKLDGQVAALSKQLQTNGDKVSQLKTGYNNAKAALTETDKEVRRLSSSWTQAGLALTNFSKKCSSISKDLSSAGRSLTTYVTTPLVALGTGAIKSAVDFESAMAGVRKTLPRDSGPEAEAMSTLSNRIQQLSLETASTAEEIAGVVETAGQLGIQFGQNGNTIMDFAKTMIMLGDSTDMAAASAAESAARFFNIMGTLPDKYDNYGSAITELGNNFATTESEIVEMSMRLAGAGRQVGLSESEILGFATALSSVGIKAQMGGSAFSKALINMELAVQTGNKQLDSFAKVSNMTAKEFAAAWKDDPAKAFQAFIEGLAQYADDEGNSAIAFLQEMGFKEIRLRDTTLRLAGSTSLLADAQESANKAWNGADVPGQNALVNEANKRYQTMASKLIQLKNKVQIFARTLGNDLMPTLTKGIGIVGGLMDKFLAMDESTRAAIEKAALFTAAIGPAILVTGKFIGLVGSVSNTAGRFSLWMGKITAAAKGTGTALGTLPIAINPAVAGIAALTVGVIAGGAALYDYASGARKAREEAAKLKSSGTEWLSTPADTFYNNASLSTFSLTKDDFMRSRTEARRWMDDVTLLWSNGEKKTSETVSKWIQDYKSLTDNTRTELAVLREEARESGNKSLSQQLSKDIRKLDSLDRQVAGLLKRKASGKLTDKEKVKLEELIQQGDAIRIKYRLEPQDERNTGYEELQKNLEAEVSRLIASGADQSEITDTYGKAAAAAAQGYAAVKEQLDENYRSRHKEIQSIDDESKKQQALDELNRDYAASRKKAALEYAGVLQHTLSPVLKEQQDLGQKENIRDTLAALRDYSNAIDSGNVEEQASALQKLNDLNLNESQLTEYYSALTQISSLLSSGLTTEDISSLFPDLDLQTEMNNLAVIQEYLNKIGDDEQLSGLKTQIGDALPQEIQQIMVGLNMDQAALDWSTFASEPRQITPAAKIESYEDSQAVAALSVHTSGIIDSYLNNPEKAPIPPSPDVTAYLNQIVNNPEGVTTPPPQSVTAYLSSLINSPDGVIPPETKQELSAYLTSLENAPDGVLTPPPQSVIAYLSAVVNSPNGVILPNPPGLAAEIISYSEANGLNVSDFLKPGGLDAVVDAYSEKTGGADKSKVKAEVTAYITRYLVSQGVTAPSLGLVGTISSLNFMEKRAFDEWKTNHPVEIEATCKVGNLVSSVQDLLDSNTVKFYENGVEVPLSPHVLNSLTLNSFCVLDEDGTIHVPLTVTVGSEEHGRETEKAMTEKADPNGFFGKYFFQSTQDKVESINNAADSVESFNRVIHEAAQSDDGIGPPADLTLQRADAIGLLNTQLQSLGDEDLQAIGDRAQYLITKLNSGEGTAEEIQSWKDELLGLQKVVDLLNPDMLTSSGSQVSAGLAKGMTDYSFEGDGTTVKEAILTAINSALGVASPAASMIPTGEFISAGIAQGMQLYDFSGDASLVSESITGNLSSALSWISLIGLNSMNAIARAMTSYSWASTASVVSNKIRQAFSRHINAEAFKPIGENAMRGLAEGIRSGSSFVDDAIVSAARSAVEKAKETLRIESPSKVFRDEVGVMVMRGFGKGIELETGNQARVIQNASRYLTERAQTGVLQGNTTNDNRRTYNNTSSFVVNQTISGSSDSYTAQQREAARAFIDAARRL